MKTAIQKNALWIWLAVAAVVIVLTVSFSPVAACVIGLLPLAVYYALAYFSIRMTPAKDILKSLTKKEIWITVAICIGFFGVMMYIIAKENFIEYWDFGAYKNFALTQGKMLFDDPWGTLQALYQSINTAEYNNLLALMISIPLMLLGGGYGACNLLVVFLFIIPFAIAFALLMRCLLQKYGLKQISFYWFVLLGFIIPPVFIPALQGYCDASVLLPIAAVTLLTLTRDLGKFNWKKNLLTGILLIYILWLRRYIAYWLLGGVLTLLIWSIFRLIILPKGERKRFAAGFCANLLMVGAIGAGVIVIFFPGYFEMMLSSRYADAYDAYGRGSYLVRFAQGIHYLGIASGILCAIGVVLELTQIRKRQFICFNAVHLVISLLLFLRIQSLTAHHAYILVLQFMVLIAGSLIYIGTIAVKSHKLNITRNIAGGFCALLVVSNFFLSLPDLSGINQKPKFFGTAAYRAKIMGQFGDIIEVRQILENVALAQNKSIYIIASSSFFNEDMIRKSYMPQNAPLNLLSVTHVDKSNGFNTDFFGADIVVVCDPVQYHLSKEGQRVITELSDIVTSEDSPLHAHYRVVDSVTLQGVDNGGERQTDKERSAVCTIYERVEPFTKEDVEYVRDRFKAYYPDLPELFENRFDQYIQTHFAQTEN